MVHEPRYGGVNDGPLVSSVTDPLERRIREAFDHFDEVCLPGPGNWLARQRTGRLCEEMVDLLAETKKTSVGCKK